MKGLSIGLTGGIACGKTSILRLFEKRGWLVLSTDQIVHREFSFNRELNQSLKSYFGDKIFKSDLSVDRDALSKIVFEDDDALVFVERKLHPKIRKIWQSFLKKNVKTLCMVEIPLLFEKNLEKFFDFTVTVSCSISTQRSRLNQIKKPIKMVTQRMNKQASLFDKRIYADYVISNQGSYAFLMQQVEVLHRFWVSSFSKYE